MPLLALLAGLVVLAGGLWLLGYDAPPALSALWRGAFGSSDALLSSTLPRAIPLIIIGLAIGFAFRAGALNIGAEGQFYAGAIAATWVATKLLSTDFADGHRLTGTIGVLAAAALAGWLWVLIPIILKVRFGVLEVITTLLLNFVAEALVSWMVTGPLREAKGVYPQSDPVPMGFRLPVMPGTRLHLGLLLGILLAVAFWVLAKKTLIGFQLRAAGVNPLAAASVGRVKTGRMMAISLGISGMIAGLAGGIELTGSSYALFQNLSPGYGFTAIAVALLARLNPLATIGTGVLFGALSAGSAAMQREAGVPAVVGSVVEATVILVLLVATAVGGTGGRGDGRTGRPSSAEQSRSPGLPSSRSPGVSHG
ncbi:MAG TPA: ABC transporter permease [Gemmatimonadales bacterium]|nr:ABC transporter permease [Gemmatimonadales bacterium]